MNKKNIKKIFIVKEQSENIVQNSSAKSAKKTLDAPLLTDKTTSLKHCFTSLEFISTSVEEPYMSKNYKEFIELHGIRKLVKICGKDFEP